MDQLIQHLVNTAILGGTYALLGIGLIFLNGVWVTLLLGMLCARFRDVGEIVASLMQVLFFLTPILWRPSSLGSYEWAVLGNPAYALIELARGPLLGETPDARLWGVALGLTIVGLSGTFFVFARFRGRIAYWV